MALSSSKVAELYHSKCEYFSFIRNHGPDNPASMHLILPFAAAQSDTGRHALQTLRLPHLDALLARLTPSQRDEGDELSLTTPHERALARAIGLVGDDGRLP